MKVESVWKLLKLSWDQKVKLKSFLFIFYIKISLIKVLSSLGEGVQVPTPADVRDDCVHLGGYGAVVPRDA